MKKINIIESEKSLTQNEIIEFQTNFNLNLPENYKKLILKYNGGIDSNGDNILSELYSIKYGTLLIERVIQTHQLIEENIPKNYLPFASTGTGNEITLNLKSGNDYGKIYLFRYDELKPIKISDSLEELFGVKNIDDL